VREAPPFLRTGVDLAGLLYVKGPTGRMNIGYSMLFSCCVTRVIYLELVDDLSAGAFLAPIKGIYITLVVPQYTQK